MKLKFYSIAILCIALFGCESPIYDDYGNEIGTDYDKAKYKWGEWRKELISIADDSLAVLAMYRPYFKEWLSCGLSCRTLSETANYHVGLFLVNYREKQKPAWGDTLEHNLIVVRDYFKDSSGLVFDRKYNKFGFWKIGSKSIQFTNYEDFSRVENRKYIGYNARPFSNGNILLLDMFDFNYPKFILEPRNRELKQFEFSGEYEWLSKCARTLDPARYDNIYNNWAPNISYIGGKLSCISGNGTTNNFELIVENVVMDTSSLSKSYIEYITGWYGNYVKDATNKVYKIDTLNFKFDSTYVPIRFNDNYDPIFYNAEDSGSGPVHYTTQDLLEVYK